ncbi:hypothetical protein GY45DRAFT_1340593 [Cubamyces sp. BRFM 1775]|nr:hypothetical protein GY45DRAFT_1340593 [Cubamyces sp. BRFM 1775]
MARRIARREHPLLVRPLRPAPLRPRDLVKRSEPPHPNPAERFVVALLQGQKLGFARLKNYDKTENITVELIPERCLGDVDEYFQDPTTWKLHLKLRPGLFMTPLCVVIDEYIGDGDEPEAPSWLSSLLDLTTRSTLDGIVKRVRHYDWLFDFVWGLFTTPGTTLRPHHEAWEKVLRYVLDIKVSVQSISR